MTRLVGTDGVLTRVVTLGVTQSCAIRSRA
jgi:hypothetical protein